MTLYAASLRDIAEPVENKIKEKKPATEKQLAALAKAQETRKRKREEADQAKKAADEEIENKKKEIEAKEAELVEKKRLQAEKRAAKKLEKMQVEEVKVPDQDLETVKKEFEKVEKKRAAYEKRRTNKVKKAASTETGSIGEAVDEAVNEMKAGEPPIWFKQFVDGVKKEEVATVPKKAKKEFKEETHKAASSSWNDGLTRDSIQHEVDNHLSKMYSMIFAGRRMK